MSWLLMMRLCLGSCEELPIDSFPTEDQCTEALTRAVAKQQVVKQEGFVGFWCIREGDKRASLLPR